MHIGNSIKEGAESLRREFVKRAERISENPWADLPDWLREKPDSLHDRDRFVICGSHLRGEIRFVASRLNIVAIVDDYARPPQEKIFGIPIIRTDDWLDLVKNDQSIVSLILVSTVPGFRHFTNCCFQHSLKWLTTLSILRLLGQGNATLPGAGTSFVYGPNYFHHAVENYAALEQRASIFDDEFSRYTYFSMLLYRLSGDPRFLQEVAIGYNPGAFSYGSYSINRSFFELSDEEVYVDGGSFNGDTLGAFIRAVEGRFRKAYCFEPSKVHTDECSKAVSRLQADYLPVFHNRVRIIQKGLWSESTVLHFHASLFSSQEAVFAAPSPLSAHVIESGLLSHMYEAEEEKRQSVEVQVTTIDEECEENASLIKFEVEGSELMALHGTANTIQKCRPKMAISMYHKPEDLLTLTQFVDQAEMGYRMSLRQHNLVDPSATVCYCR